MGPFHLTFIRFVLTRPLQRSLLVKIGDLVEAGTMQNNTNNYYYSQRQGK
jgi:hypothetical protein